MGVPMTIRTLKVCAGPATARKQGANDSSDSDYHKQTLKGGGGQIPVAARPKDRRLAFFYTAAG